jgi:hypothetical protein
MKRITINKKDVVVIICSFEDLADGGGRSMAVRSSVVAMVGFGSKENRGVVCGVSVAQLQAAAAFRLSVTSTKPKHQHQHHPHLQP